LKLEKQLHNRDINIMNRVMVTELLKDTTGHVVGAIGISTREPKLYIFRAKTIIFNKGGVGATRLYPVPHLIGYSMAEPQTGDGVMMAYRVGADLQNAELGGRQVSLRFGPLSGKGTWIGVTRDNEGNPIAPPYLSGPDAELGDMAIENADAIAHSWAMGRGPVWMDSRGISEEDERYMRWGFKSEALEAFLRWLDREKIDIKKTRFEFVPMQMGTFIHARTDAHCQTNVAGLYSISPGLLSWSAVFGTVAGKAAAQEARDIEPSDLETQREKILQLKQQYEEILNREGPQFADWREAQWAIFQIMYCYALPPLRTESTLMAGHNQLCRVREKSKRILKATNQHDLYHCLEVLNLFDVAELVLLAVNERKESRGQARRLDYPFINPMLNKFLVITQKEGKPSFRWEEPRRVSS
jgi:succinate dehydrogenase/fumarate reductase flavoprotein subunit